METKCKECKRTIRENDKAIKCDGRCESWHHAKCVRICDASYKKISDLGGLVLWLCEDDRLELKNKEFRLTTDKKMDDIQEKLNSIEKIIESIKPAESATKYADVLTINKRVPKISNIPTISIKPKKTQSSQTTKMHLKARINPADANVSIRSIQDIKNGAVLLKLNSQSDSDKMKTLLTNEISDEYEIRVMTRRKPKIKIIGADKSYDSKELKEALIKQNHWIDMADVMDVKYAKQEKNKKWTLYVEVNGKTYEKCMERKFINIGWDTSNIYEDFSILRCYNCNGFGHKSDNCNRHTNCGYCAGDHTSQNCKEEFATCVNCSHANAKYKENNDTNHHPYSSKCKILQKKIKNVQENTNYE